MTSQNQAGIPTLPAHRHYGCGSVPDSHRVPLQGSAGITLAKLAGPRVVVRPRGRPEPDGAGWRPGNRKAGDVRQTGLRRPHPRNPTRIPRGGTHTRPPKGYFQGLRSLAGLIALTTGWSAGARGAPRPRGGGTGSPAGDHRDLLGGGCAGADSFVAPLQGLGEPDPDGAGGDCVARSRTLNTWVASPERATEPALRRRPAPLQRFITLDAQRGAPRGAPLVALSSIRRRRRRP